jgi:hypothetical protein
VSENIRNFAVTYPNTKSHIIAARLWASLTSDRSQSSESALVSSYALYEADKNKGKKWSHLERLEQRKKLLRGIGFDAILLADFCQTEDGQHTMSKRTLNDAKIASCLQEEGMYKTVIIPFEIEGYEFPRCKDNKLMARLEPITIEQAFGTPLDEIIDIKTINQEPKILQGVI